ncbi:MAG: HAD hydrolase family protein [Vicinamibacterales bacterium]
MRLAAFAVDFDGTLTRDGRLGSDNRDAISLVRDRGVKVILVTGRRLDDLLRTTGNVDCFDAVVAENGAVLHFPARDQTIPIAPAPSPKFLDELRRRSIPFDLGSSVVETDAVHAPSVIEAIRMLQEPLVIVFNRGRLMALPPAVAKSTGLQRVLWTLRLSLHNTIGIGDAENDHDLLAACEIGAAVSWGSPPLLAAADEVIVGDGPSAVGRYLIEAASRPRLATARLAHRSLLLGREHRGDPVRLAIRGRSILITGEPGTGKSWLAGLLCEQLILQGYSLAVVDPEGDYGSLGSLPGVIQLGGAEGPPSARELSRVFQHPDASVVIDLSKLGHLEKVAYVRGVMPLLNALRRQHGLPHKIVLDEVHYFLADIRDPDLFDAELAGYILVTYRSSTLAPVVCGVADTIGIALRETDPSEIESVASGCVPPADLPALTTLLSGLQSNEGVLLPGPAEARGRLRRFVLASRLTEHVRHRSKYLDMPISDALAFRFGEPGHNGARARSLKEFIGILTTTSPERLRPFLVRHDFSRWLEEVFRDRLLAQRIWNIEEDRPAPEAAAAIAQEIRARYDTEPRPPAGNLAGAIDSSTKP